MSTTKSAATRQSDSTNATVPGSAQAKYRVALGILGVVGSIALLIGVPILLWTLVGYPLPTTAPSKEWLTAAITPSLIIKVISVLVWIVWAHFVVCFLTEWRAVRSGRMPAHVVMGGGSQLVARQLVAAVLLLAGGATIAHSFTTAAAAPTTQARPAVTQTVVADTESSVNESTGMVQARASDEHQPNQRLKIATVKVPDGRHHDTLWGIADRTLGDPTRWKEIYELNKGRLQPDGRKLIDADLIHPGWQMVLPHDAVGPNVRDLEGAPTNAPSNAPSNATGSAATNAGTSAAGADTSTASAGAQQGSAFVREADSASFASRYDLGALALGGGLVLAGIATAMRARRGVFGTPTEAEDAVRLAANPGRAAFIDLALRVLAETRTGQDEDLPDISIIYANDDQIVAHIAGQAIAPARPWVAAEDGRSWSVSRADLNGFAPSAPAPFPALVNIATSHGYDVLIDLEYAAGLVAISGDGSVAREIVMSSVIDLATHPWSDFVDITMVGFSDDITEISPSRIKMAADVDAALDAVEGKLGEANQLLQRLGVSGVLRGRATAAHRELQPHVIVMSGPPTAEQVQRMRALSSSGRVGFAALCVGDAGSARWRFATDADGQLDLGVLGITGVARRYTVEAHQKLRELLRGIASEAAERAEEAASASPSHVVASLRENAPDAPKRRVVGRDAAVTVQLLGPVKVTAPGEVGEAHADILTELVAMAALHPQGVHPAVLTSGLWPRGVSDDVVDRTIRDAQQWLGGGADGQPRIAQGADGLIRLSDDVYVDYVELQELATGSGEEELKSLERGLALGAGEVFSQTPAGRYGWLTFHRSARDARELITTMALKGVSMAAGNAQASLAERLLRQALVMVPEAEVLWRESIRLQGGKGPDGAGEVVKEMYRALPGHRWEPATEALVAQLAPNVEKTS